MFEVLQSPSNQIDISTYEQAILTKLNDFERRIWGELDSKQLKTYNESQSKIKEFRTEIDQI